MASVALIIVNYNAGERLVRCLDAVAGQTRKPDRIIVVDNASSDGSLELATAAHPQIETLPQTENLGFAAANNRAAEIAGTDWLALLNPDAYPEPDWLEELLKAPARWPIADAFGSLQLCDEDPAIIDGAGDNLHILGVPYRGHFGWPRDTAPGEGPVFAACAAAALYRMEAFLRLGGFDESFFCYCEDVDLGFRIRLSGSEAIHVPGARVRHEGSAIAGAGSPFQVYHGHRNRHLMLAKNLPAPLFWTLTPLHLLVSTFFMLRVAGTDIGPSYRRGLGDALGQILRIRQARKGGEGTMGTAALLKTFTWSPRALQKRRGRLLPSVAKER